MIFAIDRCVNSTANNNSCVSQAEFERVWSKVQIGVSMLTAYFDEDEFERSPIKYDIVNTKYNAFEAGEATQYVNINKKTLITYDNPVAAVFNSTNTTYYDVSLSRVSFGDMKPQYALFGIFIYCGSEETVITRTRKSLINILSIVGGFSSILLFAARTISSLYK